MGTSVYDYLNRVADVLLNTADTRLSEPNAHFDFTTRGYLALLGQATDDGCDLHVHLRGKTPRRPTACHVRTMRSVAPLAKAICWLVKDGEQLLE